MCVFLFLSVSSTSSSESLAAKKKNVLKSTLPQMSTDRYTVVGWCVMG